MGVLESYDLHEHAQRRPIISVCNWKMKKEIGVSRR